MDKSALAYTTLACMMIRKTTRVLEQHTLIHTHMDVCTELHGTISRAVPTGGRIIKFKAQITDVLLSTV